jgi:hypothetical protein
MADFRSFGHEIGAKLLKIRSPNKKIFNQLEKTGHSWLKVCQKACPAACLWWNPPALIYGNVLKSAYVTKEFSISGSVFRMCPPYKTAVFIAISSLI